MKPKARLTRVAEIIDLSPHLRRIIVTGDDLNGFPADQDGAYVKVILPEAGATLPNLDIHGEQRPLMRSYTIREFDPQTNRLVLDFVVHRHHGPATDWAATAQPGDAVGIAGPGPMKLTDFNAPGYLLVGDLTSVNAVNGYGKWIHPQSEIRALILTPTAEDIIDLDIEDQTEVQWLVDDSDTPDLLAEAILRHVNQLPAETQVFLGLEARQIRTLRTVLQSEAGIPRQQIHVTGYWKKGVDADRFGQQKQRNPL